MADTTSLIADTTQRIFRELGDPRALHAVTDRLQLWAALDNAGLTRAWVDDSLNGSGATIADGFEVLRIAGNFAADVPLAETLLASWLLAQAKISVPNGVLTVAPVDARDTFILGLDETLTGQARAVPFGRDATQLALIAGRANDTFIALVERTRCSVVEQFNVAHEPRDSISLSNVAPTKIIRSSINATTLAIMGAAVRANQMAGALQGILDLSVAYANERIAFAKPIGKFQAIQHSLAKLAGETAAAISAATSAADAIESAGGSADRFDDAIFLEVASAKIRVGEAATAGAAIAHQVHGAIGFSNEHVLHRYTQRLWAWRDDFGSESHWAIQLGNLVARNGADALWPMLAAR
jgi:acyl-CoA dehydrogenase